MRVDFNVGHMFILQMEATFFTFERKGIKGLSSRFNLLWDLLKIRLETILSFLATLDLVEFEL